MSFLDEARKRQKERNAQLNNNTESTGTTRIEEARKRVAEAQNKRLNEVAVQLPIQTIKAIQNIRQNVQEIHQTPEQRLIDMGIPADQVYQYSDSMRDTAKTIQDYSTYGSNAKRVKEQIEQAKKTGELIGNIVKVPEIMKDNLRRFDNGYQFGDVTKTGLEFVGDSLISIPSTVADVALNVGKGVMSVPENIAKAGASLIAEGAGFIGQDEFANRVRRNVAMMNIYTDPIQKGINFVDKASLSGNFLDSVASGVGQVGAYTATSKFLGKVGEIPLGRLKMPTTAILSGAGASASEAYRKTDETIGLENMTWREALQNNLKIAGGGIIEGVAEGLFELFGVGGLVLKGTNKSFSKAITEALVKKANTPFGKVVSKMVLSGVGESAEELVSYVGNLLLDNFIINPIGDVDYKSKWNTREVIEEVLTSFLTSAIAQGGTSSMQLHNLANNIVEKAEKEAGRELTENEKTYLMNQLANNILIESDVAEEKEETTNELQYPDNTLDSDINEKIEKQISKLMYRHTNIEESEIEDFVDDLLGEKYADVDLEKYRNYEIYEVERGKIYRKISELLKANNYKFIEGTEEFEPTYRYVENSELEENITNVQSQQDTTQEETVETNIGNIPIAEYRNIMAQQAGFDDYADMRRQGYKLGNDYDTDVQETMQDIKTEKSLHNVDNINNIRYNEKSNTTVTVAPYYKTEITKENFEDVKNKAEKTFLTNATDIAKEMGVNISNISTNIGGYQYENGDSTTEISYTFDLGNATPEQADLFANLMGDIGYENQETVISSSYVSNDSEGQDIMLELTVPVETTDNVAEELKGVGLFDYTIDLNKKEVRLYLETNSQAISDVTNKIELLTKKGGSKYGKAKATKIRSKLINRRARQDVYKEWQRANRDGGKSGKLRDYITKAEQEVSKYISDKDVLYDKKPTKTTESKNVKAIDNQGRTLSKEQQEYFKNSKVRDENGNLKVMYHGTPNEFTIFDSDKIAIDNLGHGFYFTDNKNIAQSYAERRAEERGGKPRLIATYIKSEKPFDMRNVTREQAVSYLNYDFYDPDNKFVRNLRTKEQAKIEAEEFVSDFEKEQQEEWGEKRVSHVENRGFIKNSKGYDYSMLIDTSNASFQKWIKEEGYDSILVPGKDKKSGLEGVAVVVFNSNQIKNVDNLKPTTSPDIRYDKKTTKIAETKEEKKPSPTSRETIINTIKEKTGIKEFSNTKKDLMEIASKIRNVIKDDSYTTNDIKNIVDEEIKNIKVAENADYYEQYKDLKKEIRKAKIYVSNVTQKKIDNWEKFRKQAMGTLTLTNDKSSLPIGTFYKKLSSKYGEDMFPSNITNLADKLKKIYDVAKSIKKNYVSLEDYIKNAEGEERLLVAKSEIVKGIKEIAKVFDEQRDIDTSKRAIAVDEDTRNVLKTLGFTDEDINDPANAYVQNIAENVFKNKDYFNKPLREIEKYYHMTGDKATNYIIEKRRFDVNNGLVERNENYMKGASRDSMRKAIEEFTGKKIGLKGFRQRAYGIYKIKFDSIRVKNINNIETIVHELGHKIQATELGDLPMEAKDELLDLAERGFGDTYDDNIPVKLSEGWAEFVRRFVASNLETIAEYPQLSKAFMQEMTANMRLGQLIENLVQKVEEYVNADSKTAVLKQISVGEQTDKPPKRNLIDQIMVTVFDDLWDVKQFEKKMAKLISSKFRYYMLKPADDPYTLLRLSKINKDAVKNVMREGLIDSNGVRRNEGLGKALEMLEKPEDIELVRALLIAERTIDYLGSNYESGITIQDAFNIIKEYGKDTIISKVANEFINYSDELLNVMADEGLIAKDDVEELRKWNKKYVPLKRVFEEQEPKGKLSKTAQKLFKQRTGSLRSIVDPLESIAENTSALLNKRNFNRVMLGFYNLIERTGDSYYVEEVDPAIIVKSEMKLEAFKKILEDNNIDTDDLDLDVVARTFAPQFSDDKNMIVGFMKNGKQKALQFKDRNLYNAVMGRNKVFEDLSDALIIFEKATGALRFGATTGNINFAVPNMISDTFTAWLFSGNNFVPVVDTLKGVFDYLSARYKWNVGDKYYLEKNKYLYDLYMQSGATMSSRIGSYRADVQDYLKEVFGKHIADLNSEDKTKVKKAVSSILDKLMKAPRYCCRCIKLLT